jgi:hypothetical protein
MLRLAGHARSARVPKDDRRFVLAREVLGPSLPANMSVLANGFIFDHVEAAIIGVATYMPGVVLGR